MNDYLPGQWAVHADIAFIPWKRPEYDASLNRFGYAFISFFDTLKWFIFGHNACRYVKQRIWLTLGSAITSRYRCVHERTLAILTIVLTRWLTVGTKSTATCHCARSCSIVCWLLLLFLFFVLPARTNPVHANQLRPVLWSALNLQMVHSVNPGSLLNRCEPEIWKKKTYFSFFLFLRQNYSRFHRRSPQLAGRNVRTKKDGQMLLVQLAKWNKKASRFDYIILIHVLIVILSFFSFAKIFMLSTRACRDVQVGV